MPSGFDAMAVAVDWLDACRAAKLDAVLDLYADDASLECGCGGQTILVGKPALKEYWVRRFTEDAPLELDDIQPAGEGDGVVLAYRTREGRVRVVFAFDDAGKIARMQCERAAEVVPLHPPSAGTACDRRL